MFQIALVLVILLQSAAPPAQPDEIKDALAHAEALYYGAHFSESIALLTRIDDVLKTQPGGLQEKLRVKLQLALSHVGLNETAEAKAYFVELYALDPNYALDAKQFSPKVVSVATDAKTEQAKVRCDTALTDARADLDSGQTTAFLELLRSTGSKCTVLAAMGPEAAETFYRTGLASYRRGEFSSALSSFEMALTLSPEHELAREYADLAHGKLQLGQAQLLIQWQQNFDAHQFAAARADYVRIMSPNSSEDTSAASHVTEEYRKALSSLVEDWNRSCGHAEAATMNAIRGQISELLPEPTFGDDIRRQMTSCEEQPKPAATTAPADVPVEPVTPKVGNFANCLDMQTQLALTRLKSRVDPVITNDVRIYLKNNPDMVVRVKARINENGNVKVTAIPGGNPILNSVISNAVEQWKFTPIRDESGARCVDTQIPLVFRRGQ
jgi:tetratricopeptide (TPR) repeat protein